MNGSKLVFWEQQAAHEKVIKVNLLVAE